MFSIFHTSLLGSVTTAFCMKEFPGLKYTYVLKIVKHLIHDHYYDLLNVINNTLPLIHLPNMFHLSFVHLQGLLLIFSFKLII
jgi:hypothetical protein